MAGWPAASSSPRRCGGRGIFAGGAILSAEGELMVAALQRAVAVEGIGVPLGLGKAPA